MTSIVSELQKVSPSAIIELFRLELVQALHGSTEVYRFHAGANAKAGFGTVVWNAEAYDRYPIEVEGFEYNGGQLPRPKLRISNALGLISAVLAEIKTSNRGSDLTGAKLTRIRTCARYLDAVNFPGDVNPYGTPDPTAEAPREIYYVDRKTLESRDVVEFELAAAFDLAGVRAPKRQCIANICQWQYRSAECGYTGSNYFDADDKPVATLALDVCAKRLSSCEKRFDPNNDAGVPFGSYPSVGTYYG